MRKIFCFILTFILTFSLVACGSVKTTDEDVITPDTSISESATEDTTSEPVVEDVETLTAKARAFLEEEIGTHLGDEEAVDTLMAQVPDIHLIENIRHACWTYFLHMSDGTEYIVTTTYEGHITSICYWIPDPGELGEEIYLDPVE